MKRFSRRIVAVMGLSGMGGYLLSGPGTGCTSFVAESTLTSANFCFIFDCQNGILGGTIDPCSGIGSGDNTVEGNFTGLPLFTDCPLAAGG
jgi:hypothetical protein